MPRPDIADVDLLAGTAELVDVASVSFAESALVALIEERFARCGWLETFRVGDNVVARTQLGRPQRLILAGHTDTVPPNGNEHAHLDGDRLWGVGSADMKGGLAVMLAIAEHLPETAVDVSYVFYAREEVAARHSGLEELFATAPELLVGDAAILGEPTNAVVEAGCQGSIRYHVTFAGARAHTARAWMGENAIHRLGPLLVEVADHTPRQPVIAGCRFREALQVVAVEGGVAGNVVPDAVRLTISHRFAPDRTTAQAETFLRELLGRHLGERDVIEVDDVSHAAAPGVDHPLLARLAIASGQVQAKLGWTDVARFAARGVPAVNYGPGDAAVAHTAGEHLDRAQLHAVRDALVGLVTDGRGASSQ